MKQPSRKAVARALKEQPARQTILNSLANRPTRLIYDKRPLKGRKGMTKRNYLQPVEAGDARYDAAPYEFTTVFYKDVLKVKL